MRYTRHRQYPVEDRGSDEAGSTLHGGQSGTAPILADHLDQDMHDLTGRIDDHDAAISGHETRLEQVEAPEHVAIHPPASAAAQHLAFNHNWGLYVDNTTITGEAGSRLWLDAPDRGDVVIGPRSGSHRLGEVRIRTAVTTSSSANMYINPATFIIARATSAAQYKTDITGHQFNLDAIRALRPVQFRDRAEAAADPDHAQWHVGLLAEDVAAAGLPELVTFLNGRPDAVAYGRLPVALLQLVADVDNRARERISALEAAVAALTERVTDLEGAVLDALYTTPGLPSRAARHR